MVAGVSKEETTDIRFESHIMIGTGFAVKQKTKRFVLFNIPRQIFSKNGSFLLMTNTCYLGLFRNGSWVVWHWQVDKKIGHL